MREICTSGSVRGEGGNILTYSAHRRPRRLHLIAASNPPLPTLSHSRGVTQRGQRRGGVVHQRICPGRLCPPYLAVDRAAVCGIACQELGGGPGKAKAETCESAAATTQAG